MLAGFSGSDFYERGLLLKKVQIFDMALKEFQQATKDPEQAGKAFAQMALCFIRLERQEEAVSALRQALAIGPFSPIECLHMQYLLAQTLESLDRRSEALVVYRRIQRKFPNFQDVDARIQDLSSRKLDLRLPVITHQSGDVAQLWAQVKPQLTSLLNQTWQRLAHYDVLDRDTPRPLININMLPSVREQEAGPVSSQKTVERRGQGRVAVKMVSQFFSKARTGSGEGEVRDLSPSGCRITSPARVALGAAVECWIYPQDGQPFAVEQATVQWRGHREFGLHFNNVRFGVQRQITEMCREARQSTASPSPV